MPVEIDTDFSQAILDEAKQEVEEILDLARREAERILDGAREELDQVHRTESLQTATQMAKTRYKQIIAAAELESRKQQLLGQERLIIEVQEQVQERLRSLRSEPSYPDLLVRLITEGVAALDGSEFEIIVNPEDHSLITPELLQNIGEKTEMTLVLSEHSEPEMVGAIVQRADKRVRCDNSLQGILQRRDDEIRLLIAKNLFSL